jgi:hypothetical protein
MQTDELPMALAAHHHRSPLIQRRQTFHLLRCLQLTTITILLFLDKTDVYTCLHGFLVSGVHPNWGLTMRLLECNAATEFSLTKDFIDENIPRDYAILSHTWGNDGEEVTLDELQKRFWQGQGRL